MFVLIPATTLLCFMTPGIEWKPDSADLRETWAGVAAPRCRCIGRTVNINGMDHFNRGSLRDVQS